MSGTVPFDVLVHTCPSCGRSMVHPPPKVYYASSTFPVALNNTFEEQRKKRDLELVGQAVDADGNRLCETCTSAGKATFLCAHCGETKESKFIHKSFGDPPEYLCKPCWHTVPASQWEEICEKLEENHAYDFE